MPTLCLHNVRTGRPDPQHPWACAACGHIYGLGDRQLKVISGGQTGIDQLALRVALAHGVPTGGWIPKGWVTEDGPNPDLATFKLMEHTSPMYPPRTKANVRMADGTVWFGGTLTDSRGFRLTQDSAATFGKPFLPNPDLPTLVGWMTQQHIRVLNVAGSRGSNLSAASLERARAILTRLLQ